MYDVIIIGAGPAGLTASIYAKRANKKVLVLEAISYGGKIINAEKIENYPAISNISGYDFATNLYNQVKSLGVEIKYETVLSIINSEDKKEVITKDNKYISKTIIIASGTHNRKLNLKNENNLIGRGISYCATCDGNLYRNKVVAVVGGGNTALEDAIYLSNIVNSVYLIHRKEKLDSIELYTDKIKDIDNIKLLLNSNIITINGEDKLDSITISHDEQEETIKIDGLFVAIGRIPNNNIFKDLVDLDKDGYIISDDKCHTKTPGIYVAGDTRKKELKQLVTATADGAIAATEAIKFINTD